MKSILRGIAALALLFLLMRTASAADYTVETYSSGVLGIGPPVKNALIRSGGELAETKIALGITGTLPDVDFGKEALLLMVSPEGKGGIIDVTGAVPSAGALEIRYRVRAEGPMPESPRQASYTYLIARLKPVPGEGVPVRFIEEGYVNTLASGTGLGQFSEYTNVLPGGAESTINEYLPLDKGNTWTYTSGSGGGATEVTNSVVSESDGWSVFDAFFGVPGVGMKINPGGEVLVSSGGGVKTFYTPDVRAEVRKGPVITPAGEFSDVMVVTVPEDGDFWFRDVYAKGVGLVTHEHNSRKGSVAYTLVRAVVGGKEYPRSKDGPDSGKK